MTIDTNFPYMTASKIQPIKAGYNDAASSTHLGIKLQGDDLSTHAIFHCALMDDDGSIYLAFNQIIAGDDYQNWGGDNLFPFTFVAGLNNLTLI